MTKMTEEGWTIKGKNQPPEIIKDGRKGVKNLKENIEGTEQRGENDRKQQRE